MSFGIELGRTLGRVLKKHWAAILLIQLTAGILQTLHQQFAVDLGRSDAVQGLLLNGMGTLVAVAGLVAICVVCHGTLQSTENLPGDGRARWKRIGEIFAASILPFFLTYVAWGLFEADVRHYARAALNSLDFSQGQGGAGSIVDVRFTGITIAIIVAAFLGRILVRRFLRAGVLRTVLALLLEAVWAFLAALLIGKLVSTMVAGAGTTNLAVWMDRAVAGLPWPNLATAVLGFVSTVLVVIFIPLLWVTLAGITVVRGSFDESRLSTRMQAWVDRMPPVINDLLADFVIDLEDRWIPVIGALSTMVRSGAVAMAGAVFAGVLTTFTGGWLTYGLAHLFGPTEPYGRLIGETLISFGGQLTLAATVVVALASFDAFRVLQAGSGDLGQQPGRRVGADLQEQ
ncbi:hypothetical protein [Enemella sp. A6]|uniref:hypothetical protein n=1 Tax=Enemella sp. A6 TaxID=3440152 RepID=UPI003EBC3AA7